MSTGIEGWAQDGAGREGITRLPRRGEELDELDQELLAKRRRLRGRLRDLVKPAATADG